MPRGATCWRDVGRHFAEGPVRSFEDAQGAETALFGRFFRACLAARASSCRRRRSRRASSRWRTRTRTSTSRSSRSGARAARGGLDEGRARRSCSRRCWPLVSACRPAGPPSGSGRGLPMPEPDGAGRDRGRRAGGAGQRGGRRTRSCSGRARPTVTEATARERLELHGGRGRAVHRPGSGRPGSARTAAPVLVRRPRMPAGRPDRRPAATGRRAIRAAGPGRVDGGQRAGRSRRTCWVLCPREIGARPEPRRSRRSRRRRSRRGRTRVGAPGQPGAPGLRLLRDGRGPGLRRDGREDPVAVARGP